MLTVGLFLGALVAHAAPGRFWLVDVNVGVEICRVTAAAAAAANLSVPAATVLVLL